MLFDMHNTSLLKLKQFFLNQHPVPECSAVVVCVLHVQWCCVCRGAVCAVCSGAACAVVLHVQWCSGAACASDVPYGEAVLGLCTECSKTCRVLTSYGEVNL